MTSELTTLRGFLEFYNQINMHDLNSLIIFLKGAEAVLPGGE